MPKFISIEDPAINRQVKYMLHYTRTWDELMDMHSKVYGSNPDKLTYMYFWLKYMCRRDKVFDANYKNWLLDNGVEMAVIQKHFPHLFIVN